MDIYNKWIFGPKSAQSSYRCRDWRPRFVFATMAMAETNAFLAYRFIEEKEGRSGKITHSAYRKELIVQLLEVDGSGARNKSP